jgi:hypothetical protein
MAAQIGVLRQLEAVRKGLPDRHGFDGDTGWTIHIEGAAGEIAAAKALGLYWGGTVNTFKTEGDVGNIEVRTRSKPHYDLLVRDNDKNESVFVLVTGKSPKYNVVGWILGKDAKKTEWYADYGNRPPAYFVPQNCLRPIEELKNASSNLVS